MSCCPGRRRRRNEMPAWVRKPVQDDRGQLVFLKKLVKCGNGYVLTIPKDWLRVYALEEDGRYWVNCQFDGKEFVIRGAR